MNQRVFACRLIVLAAAFLLCGPAAAGLFVDEAGRKVMVPGEPRRIVSLAPSVTEILFALGLEERVVGVTEFSNHPPEAAAKPRVGSFVRLNAERILDLAPDLAIGTVEGNRIELVRLLEDAGVAVYAVNPQSVKGMIRTVAGLGAVCGVEDRGDALARDLEARLGRVAERIRASMRPRVFLQINTSPIMSVNRDSLHHDVIRLAGGDNITADHAATYPRVNLEEVLAKGPDVILISSMERGGEFEEARQAWFQWKTIPAVKSGRVHLVDSDLIDRPSPRIIEGLEAVAELLHPVETGSEPAPPPLGRRP
jgi:iron complex transport system substrate-binding protein